MSTSIALSGVSLYIIVFDLKQLTDTLRSDIFNSNYAVEFVRQMRQGQFDIEKAISRACKAVARTFERLDCQNSIPWKDELEMSTDIRPVKQPDIVEPSMSAAGNLELVHAMEASQLHDRDLLDGPVPTTNGIHHSTPSLREA